MKLVITGLKCNYKILYVASIFLWILFLAGCEQQEPAFELPVIITNLSEEDAFEQGSMVTIQVDLEESRIGIIEEVRIFIDNLEVLVTQEVPCYLEWDSESVELGIHTVKFISTDTKGNTYSEEYIVRIYIVNRQPCPDTPTVTDWNGNTYRTIQIGDQCWMKENLKSTHYADGTLMVDGTGATDTRYDYTTKYYFIYNNDTSNIETYGLLYIWMAAVDGVSSEADPNPGKIQGVCPDGWHLPSNSEWKELEIYLGMSPEEADDRDWRGTIEGGMLKEPGTEHWAYPNSGATNESGFTALPGGNRNLEGYYVGLGNNGSFWTSTNHIAINDTHNPAFRRLDYEESRTFRYQGFHGYLTYARSVRCVKDE